MRCKRGFSSDSRQNSVYSKHPGPDHGSRRAKYTYVLQDGVEEDAASKMSINSCCQQFL